MKPRKHRNTAAAKMALMAKEMKNRAAKPKKYLKTAKRNEKGEEA